METYKKTAAITMIRKSGGHCSTAQLGREKLSSRQIAALVKEGIISKTARGHYKLNSDDFNQFSEFIDVCNISPSAVIYLESAIVYHQLSNINPQRIVFAVPRNGRAIPDMNLPIRRHFISRHIYELGILPVETASGTFRIYDLDKTVCDVVKHRNKLGNEILAEVLNNYLKLDSKSISKLMSYARIMRLEKVITEYIGVLQW